MKKKEKGEYKRKEDRQREERIFKKPKRLKKEREEQGT